MTPAIWLRPKSVSRYFPEFTFSIFYFTMRLHLQFIIGGKQRMCRILIGKWVKF